MSNTDDWITDGGWIKSWKSGQGADCVMMRPAANGDVELCDSKQQGQGPILPVTRNSFAALLAGARSGELDHLI